MRLKELKEVLDKRQSELKAKQGAVAKGADYAQKLEVELREQKQLTDRALKEVDVFTSRVSKCARAANYAPWPEPVPMCSACAHPRRRRSRR